MRRIPLTKVGAAIVLSLGVVGLLYVTATRATAAELDKKTAAVLDSVQQFYKGLDGFHVDATMEVHQELQGQKLDMTLQYALAMRQPNLLSVRLTEGQDQNLPAGTVVADGTNLYTYQGTQDKYAVEQTPETLQELMNNTAVRLLGLPLGDVPMFDQGIAGLPARLVREDPQSGLLENISKGEYVGKETIDEAAYHHIRLVNDRAPLDLWIRAGEKPYLWKIEPDLTKLAERTGREGLEITATVRYENWRPNAEAADTAFAFKIPSEAEEVDSLFDTGSSDSSGSGGAEALEGDPAPGFTLENLDGEKVELASHQGQQVVVLDFWATWCGPCREAMPIVEKTAAKYPKAKLYAVNLREQKNQIRGFLDKQGLEVDVLLDKDGAVANEYKARAIPQTVVIGADGTVEKVVVGAVPDLQQQLEAAIEPAVAQLENEQ